jgi:hypothetical protein
MDKTFTFKDNELRLADSFIELDMKEVPYTGIEKISLKKAVYGVKGELRIKPSGSGETRLFFKRAINKQVRTIAAYISKASGVEIQTLKKGRSKLPFVLVPLVLAAAAAVYFIFIHNNNDDDMNNQNYMNDYWSDSWNDPWNDPWGNEHFGFDGFDSFGRFDVNEFHAGEEFTSAVTADFLTFDIFNERLNAINTASSGTLHIHTDYTSETEGSISRLHFLFPNESLTVVFNSETNEILNVSYVWEGDEFGRFGAYMSMGALLSALTGLSADAAMSHVTTLFHSGLGMVYISGYTFILTSPNENFIILSISKYD